MSLVRLDCTGLRNLESLSLKGLERTNVVFGQNGSGKTSLLEGIHLLGMARSFRTSSIKPVINHDQERCTVFGEIRTEPSHGALTVGVSRARDGTLDARLGGEAAQSRSALAEALPLQLIHADSFEILTGSPQTRRHFVDWGVFHVEHLFLPAWQRFQRAIKQRNNLLRRGKIDDASLAPWDNELAIAGEAVDGARQRYLRALEPRFIELASRLCRDELSLSLRYRRGWDAEASLKASLDASRSSDVQQGYTHSGPQRADIRVLAAGRNAAETLSRGQLKLVICALKLSQGVHMLEAKDKRCVYLIDDLTAELDRDHCVAVASILEEIDAQVFVTCIERQDAEAIWPGTKEQVAMFHVEHGRVKRVA